MKKLNSEQEKAVSHLEGSVMVLAGPGTGKTQIIALRIAKILAETQMSPHNILCLTFTESGVVAMRRRLLEFTGPAAYSVRIHTFHSFCNEIIQDFPEKFLFARGLTPLTDVERIQLFRSLMDGSEESSPLKPFGEPYFYVRELIKCIRDLKREDISPQKLEEALGELKHTLQEHGQAIEDFLAIHGNQLMEADVLTLQSRLTDTAFNLLFEQFDLGDKKARTALKAELKTHYWDMKNQIPKQEALLDFYRRYQAELQKRGRYDFEDMILFVVEKLRKDGELLARYQEQYQYILVDEYQDTNGAQNEVVRLIGAFFADPNIFVVGDDKQSIYRFQGASLENLVGFYHLYKKNVQLISLKQNYRSQQTVLDAAEALIQHNEAGLTQLIPELSSALESAVNLPRQNIQIAQLETQGSERYFVAKQIESLLKQGCSPSEIAVIYRNNRDAREFRELFLRLKIPFRLAAGENLLHAKSIQKVLILLRFLVDLRDEHQLFHLLHHEWFAFPSLEIAKLSRDAAQQHQRLFDAMMALEIFAPFTQKLADWHNRSFSEPIVEFFDRLLKETGILDWALRQENQIEELNRLNSLFDELKTINAANPKMELKDFVELLDLLEENNLTLNEHPLRTQKDAVSLMTAHKSKGLEFEHVFIVHVVDKHWGNVPNRSLIKLPQNLLKVPTHTERNEEERRLFYVALTRAKKNITLSYAHLSENLKPQVPSVFLAELPQELITYVDTAKVEEEALERFQTLFLMPTSLVREDEKAYIKALLENYKMSVTHLNNYLRCPRLFYYNNLLRVPRAKSKHEAFGSAIHESLKDLLLETRKGKLPSKEYLLEQFETHLRREVLSQQEFRGCLELGRDSLAGYYEQYHSSFPHDALVEYDFSGHGVEVDGVPLTGKLDKIEILDSIAKTVYVTDYKTGNPDSKAGALAPDGEYRRQILFYKLLCDYSTQFPFRMLSGEIDFIQKSKKEDRFVRRRIEPNPQELAALRKTIKDVYSDIQELRFLRPDEWTGCGECEWCHARL